MARRFQTGSIEISGSWYVVRFWKDGADKRIHACERICPTSGLGYLPVGERRSKAQEIIASMGVNDAPVFANTHTGVTFREQAKLFLDIKKSRRKGIKPATLQSWESALDTWLYKQSWADAPVSDIGDRELKSLVDAMDAAKKSAQTIRTYVTLAKMIIGSATDAKGRLIPRKWNRDVIDAPAIEKQRQPMFSPATISALVERSSGPAQMLYALLAGTGMRVGELLGLDVSNIAPDCRTIHVKESLWQNQLVKPKTTAAIRSIELCQPLADMLREFVGTRKQGLLFQNAKGRGLAQSNVIRRHLHPMLKELGIELQGFHGFRRHRVTHLRRQRVQEGVIRYWVGHSAKNITDKYDKQEDADYRLQVADQVGLGFSIVRTVRNSEVGVEGRNAQIAA